ncbi:esterase [Xenorhabdus szentirmaii]|uniref:Phospholipase/carboxylesterase/thioesterase domain-containing protein n=1 Tax=Xenorhabdus szentirmaii DSM 16338 TaxID=1427518 RepID=W1J5N7_9GAMM|nr:esterase [Xenorhabdus szentirmaii]PHM32981.1 esterase [Xenorhabdus szentirmaii DSM 16338]PHM40699.1 esterase [Xenorhabdus szentirmaii]CDL85166.1 conserved exported hypothetical protein [Xenorhabdus szentirmaii DSM 16338]
MKNKLLVTILLLAPLISWANVVFDEFPKNINPDEKYVFYNHGKVLEGNIEKPVNPSKPHWGVYDFPGVKESLSDPDYHLIAYHRPKNTNPFEYAKKLNNDINKLIKAGVLPQNITIIGFSRGGEITIYSATELKNKNISYIILAACSNEIQRNKKYKLYGHVYSVIEKSDEVGSCDGIKNNSGDNIRSYDELLIDTGQSHGVFFRPNPEWVKPVKDWIKRNN